MGRRAIPALPLPAENHTATSFLGNIIPICRRNNMDHNACKCAITGSVIFNSECTMQNRLSVTLRQDPLEELTLLLKLSSWILERGPYSQGKGHK